MEEQQTCGRGLAQNAAVPAALAAAAAGLAQNLEVHVRALDPGEAAAAEEQGVYQRVAHRLRRAAAELQAAAAEMASAVDLPMGAHDMAAITTTDVLDAFRDHVAAEDDLRRLLEARRVENQLMLAAIREEVGGPDVGGRPAP
ncbi:hypothetical protein [Modestobacter sp. I12A-02662]|uniref:hypothetical protein n=1 Tax=Modestobacter sp. I12A-02662 TaxID=1730496 RepID=UPI0034DED4D2